ncbi:2,3-bisphosphoglycerate-independent phosphoglycerate mutase [Candidatus Parcubacteria bacterium]|nr:2,3-bisphosphoglycerate-independent phosphoglycerate mutase [Candidatus Parcubacteria bacterium]
MDNINKNKRPKPLVLIILDGWGINQDYPGNAITQANIPFYDSLLSEYPATTLRASGEAVGLPWGESGNSEVGHLNLGMGRILYQDLSRINKDIGDGSFFNNEILLESISHVKKNNSKLHLVGLVSNGAVHSTIDHLHALLELVKRNNVTEIYIHAILDGRDTPFNSGKNYIREIERKLKKNKFGKIVSVIGRFYAMDRNNNWDRTERAYLAMTAGKGSISDSAMGAVTDSYSKKNFDEEFIPTVISDDKKNFIAVDDNDAIIFFNYRSDRARQLTKAFVSSSFTGFKRSRLLKNLCFVSFTEYEKYLPAKVAFPQDIITITLGDVLSQNGLKQLRIAETEKYAHVTYFFNGGHEEKNPGEDHILIPSPAVSSYDQKPEMSAREVTKKITQYINEDKYDFILVNFANCDMVGHTGNIKAAIKAIESIDECLEKVVKAILKQNGLAIITADHGNAEVMFNMQMGRMDKEHTANPVPFILVGNDYAGRNFGWKDVPNNDLSLIKSQGILSDIAPTILKILGIKKPEEMAGKSLI